MSLQFLIVLRITSEAPEIPGPQSFGSSHP